MSHILAQKVIDEQFVECPHCSKRIDLEKEDAILVCAPNLPDLCFCSWKCLGRWITETYEQGKQFKYGLEVK